MRKVSSHLRHSQSLCFFSLCTLSSYIELSENSHLSHFLGSSFFGTRAALQRKGSDGPNTGPLKVVEAVPGEGEVATSGTEVATGDVVDGVITGTVIDGRVVVTTESEVGDDAAGAVGVEGPTYPV